MPYIIFFNLLLFNYKEILVIFTLMVEILVKIKMYDMISIIYHVINYIL